MSSETASSSSMTSASRLTGTITLSQLAQICPDPDAAIAIYQQLQSRGLSLGTATNKPTVSPLRFLMDFARFWASRSQNSGELAHMDKSLSFIAKAKEVLGSEYDASLNKDVVVISSLELGMFLRRLEHFGEMKDIESAIVAWKIILDRIDNDGWNLKAGILSNLGVALVKRFDWLGALVDINNAILLQEQAIDFIPEGHSSRSAWLNNLGNLLLTRFKRLGNSEDLDNAILKQQQAVALTPDGHPHKAPWLGNLGISLRTRFERRGDLEDLQNSLRKHQEAIDLLPDQHPEKHTLLGNLGNSLLRRYERLGHLADIDSAILKQRQAVDLIPNNHPDTPRALNDLGNALLERFGWSGDLDDINNAILHKQQSVDLTPNEDPNKPSRLNNLGVSLYTRFNRLGNLVDLDNAILIHNQAVDLTPDSHEYKPSFLNNLGNSLRFRFVWLGDIVDLDNAILKQQQAVDLTPDGHASRPTWLTNLGITLLRRFKQQGNLADIDNAICSQQQAVDLIPDNHGNKSSLLNNLGISLQTRFEKQGDLADIHNAISSLQQAINLLPRDHADKPTPLHNLGLSLKTRFERLGNVEDIKEAILVQQQAVDLTPDGHADKSARLNSLGKFLLARFELLQLPEDTDNSQQLSALALDGQASNLSNQLAVEFSSIVSSFRAAALSPTGKPLIRFRAAHQWARLVYPNSGPEQAIEPYQTTISLIPQVIWLGRTVEQRYQDLHALGDAVMEGVSVACAVRDYNLALEWLEQGRAIIWGQILRLRSPIDSLEAAHPELAKKLSEIAGALELAGTANNLGPDGSTTSSLEQAAQEHHRLAEKWESLLITIRALPDFADFLQPKPASVLKKAATNGTIIIVNVSNFGSDALVLQPASPSIEHVHLATLSLKKLKSALTSLNRSLRAAGVRTRHTERGSTQAKFRDALPNVLKMLWTDVAKPILDYLGYSNPPPATENLPHITWCLTGPLASLPLHAAGLYDSPFGQEKLFDYISSSYTPSLTSLLEGLDKTPNSTPSILAITQEGTPNLPRLPGTVKEVNQVEGQLKEYNIPMTRMDGKQATIRAVSEAMNKHSWVHLSCHGKQDTVEPTKSAFFLNDGRLELVEIMKKPLKQAELAYLSACETATGDSTLPNEAMHLAAGMFIAGYRSVVGTLWSIKDNDAPLVAQVFYEQLLSNPEGGAGRALNAAVAALRNSKQDGDKDLISWVPYIHIGH